MISSDRLLAPAVLLCSPAEAPAASHTVARRLLAAQNAAAAELDMIDLRSVDAKIAYTRNAYQFGTMCGIIKGDEKYVFLSLVWPLFGRMIEATIDIRGPMDHANRARWDGAFRELVLRNIHQFWFQLGLLGSNDSPLVRFPEEDPEGAKRFALGVVRVLMQTAPTLLELERRGRTVHDMIAEAKDLSGRTSPWYMLWGGNLLRYAYEAGVVPPSQNVSFRECRQPEQALALLGLWLT